MNLDTEVFIHPTAIVEEGAQIGRGTKIWHHCHVRAGAVIGENCNIGKNVYVDIGAKIGSGVKIQNNVSVYQGVTLEDDVFVGPSVVFTNDRIPRAFGDWGEAQVIETRVHKGASLGGGACLRCGVNIGEYAMVAMGAVVIHSVESFTLVAGNPAAIKGRVNKEGIKIEKA